MPNAKHKVTVKHPKDAVPVFRGPMHDAKGGLNRSAYRRIVERQLPLARLGLLDGKRHDDGMPVEVMLIIPQSRNKRPYREFAKAVTQHDLHSQYNHRVLAAEAIDIRSKGAPDDSWVLHLSHRAYPKAGEKKFRVMGGMLLRVDPVPLQLYSQRESPGPVRRQEEAERLEHYTKYTTIDEAIKMTQCVQYGELHTSRRHVPQLAQFFRLYARGVVHEMQPRSIPLRPEDFPMLC